MLYSLIPDLSSSILQGEPVKKGVFGKCLVERKLDGFNENIFEFNLTKCGNEGEFQYDNTDGWSLMATRELASKPNKSVLFSLYSHLQEHFEIRTY